MNTQFIQQNFLLDDEEENFEDYNIKNTEVNTIKYNKYREASVKINLLEQV